MVLHFFFCFLFFFFNDTATTEIYTLSLHDALPICTPPRRAAVAADPRKDPLGRLRRAVGHRRRRSEEHTSELQSRLHLVCRLLLEKKKKITCSPTSDTYIYSHILFCAYAVSFSTMN